MKGRLTVSLLVAGACNAALFTAHADKVQLQQLPQQVQDKIRAQTGSNQIDDIDRDVRNGTTTYEVGFKKDGQQTELRFDQNGQLLTANGTPATTNGKVGYRDLPEAVRTVIRARKLQSPITDINRQVTAGQTSYAVNFTENGSQHELMISEDGRILSDVAVSPSSTAVAAATTSTAATTMKSPMRVQLSNSRKMNFSNAPQAVQNTVIAQARGARIEDFEMGTWNGLSVYEAAFKSGPRNIEVQVAADGSLVNSPLVASSNSGVAAASATGTSSSQLSNTPVNLSSSEKVDQRSVPAAVQRAIQQYTNGARVEDIEKGGWQGRTVYEIAFKDNGRHVELQVDENGVLVHDPRVLGK